MGVVGSSKDGADEANEGSVSAARISADAILTQLDRIVASRGFSQSERLSRLLRFTVDQVVQGKVDQLKEYCLGVEVFDRRESFDPSTDSIVRVQAGRLRAKLNDYYETTGRDDPIRIEIPKGGYVPVFHQRRAPAVQPPASLRWPYLRVILVIALAGAAVAGAYWTVTRLFSPPRTASIAVLPFVNMTGSPENEPFSDGLTEELIHALTKFEQLRVPARTSVFKFKGKPVDIRKIGEQLRVQTVLEGSVRQASHTLRVTAQLNSVADGYHLWSEQYETERKGVFEIQDEIVRKIATALNVRLQNPSQRLVKRYTENAEAYRLYQKARYFWNQRTLESYLKATTFFEYAIEQDPGYAPAYVGLADSWISRLSDGVLSPQEFKPKVETAIRRALEIDDTLAEAHTSLAYVYFHDRRWTEADKEFQKASALNPGYVTTHHWYGQYLAAAGRFDESISQMRRAVDLDPLSLPINGGLGLAFFYGRRPQEAIEQLKKTVAMGPSFAQAHSFLGQVYLQQRMYPQALEQLHRAASAYGIPDESFPEYAVALAESGRGAEALQIAQAYEKAGRQTYVSPYSIAIIYAGLRDSDRAIDWLEKAYAESNSSLVFLKVRPTFEFLHSDPRFLSLLKRIGLAL